MDRILEVENLNFRYPNEHAAVLDDVSFSVKSGEFVVLCGPSGCGKTTLLRMIKQEIAPAGERRGRMLFQHKDYEHHDHGSSLREIGMVFQDPENQIVMDEVMQELVFGLENLGLSTSVMRKRVAEMVHFFGLEPLLHRKTFELSGGQKQLVNLASVILLHPKLLLLDEPTAQLDPVAAKEFIDMVYRLNREFGITVLLVEHRLEEVFALADRVLMMNGGKITHDGNPREVLRQVWEQKDHPLVAYLPVIATLYFENESDVKTEEIPLTVREGRSWVRTLSFGAVRKKEQLDKMDRKEPLLTAKNLCFQYEKDVKPVLQHLSFEVRERELLTIVGGNGSGKSTLLKVLSGLLKPQRGRITYRGRKLDKYQREKLAYLPQNPKLYFLQDTVKKELETISEAKTHTVGGKNIEELLAYLDITHVLERHPYDLSGGEMQKAALACVLLQQPEVLLVDEPTKGLDPVSKRLFGELLHWLNKDGLTIILVTHDVEFAANYATRCAMMFEGEITTSAPAGEFFKDNTFYTTVINRITRDGSLPEVLTLEEARSRWRVLASPSLS